MYLSIAAICARRSACLYAHPESLYNPDGLASISPLFHLFRYLTFYWQLGLCSCPCSPTPIFNTHENTKIRCVCVCMYKYAMDSFARYRIGPFHATEVNLVVWSRRTNRVSTTLQLYRLLYSGLSFRFALTVCQVRQIDIVPAALLYISLFSFSSLFWA